MRHNQGRSHEDNSFSTPFGSGGGALPCGGDGLGDVRGGFGGGGGMDFRAGIGNAWMGNQFGHGRGCRQSRADGRGGVFDERAAGELRLRAQSAFAGDKRHRGRGFHQRLRPFGGGGEVLDSGVGEARQRGRGQSFGARLQRHGFDGPDQHDVGRRVPLFGECGQSGIADQRDGSFEYGRRHRPDEWRVAPRCRGV